MINNLLVAFCLVLIVEGIGPMLFPNRWRAYLNRVAQMPSAQLRTLGGVMVICGLVSLFYFL